MTEKGTDIYVHSKVMIVDDAMIKVGSANLNNRSMGLDSECDVMIDAHADPAAAATIARLRADLLAEHLGVDAEAVAGACDRTGSLIATIEELRGPGRSLVPFEPPELSKMQKKLARSEWLDPEGPDELFEKRARPGLLSRLGGRRRS